MAMTGSHHLSDLLEPRLIAPSAARADLALSLELFEQCDLVLVLC